MLLFVLHRASRKKVSAGGSDSSDELDHSGRLEPEQSSLIERYGGMDRVPPTTNLRFMSFFYGLTAGLSSLIIVLILVWAFHFRDGFGWQSNPQLEFNWHPLLMVLSLVVLYGHGNARIRRQQVSPAAYRKMFGC